MKKSFTAQAGRIARRGFTLTELLLVIIIIAILAAMTLTVQRSAVQSTRRERTIATIRKIDAALTAAYEKYQYRKPDVNYFIESTEERLVSRYPNFKSWPKDEQKRWIMGTVVQDIASIDSPWWPFLDREDFEPGIDHQFAPYILRTVMLRELLMMDFPDCLAEVKYIPRLSSVSSVHLAYQNQLPNLISAASSAPDGDISADLLYLIIMNTSPETRETFLDREISDTNNNGIPEFIDGWGNPIRFIRWAPALPESNWGPNHPENIWVPAQPESNRQPAFADAMKIAHYRYLKRHVPEGYELSDSDDYYSSDLFYSEIRGMTPWRESEFYTYFDLYYPGLLDQSVDPFDPTGSLDGWLLTPFIYSAGPDREYGMFPNCHPYDRDGNVQNWNKDRFIRLVPSEPHLQTGYQCIPSKIFPASLKKTDLPDPPQGLEYEYWNPKDATYSYRDSFGEYVGLGDWFLDRDGNAYSRDNITNHNLE